MMTSGNKQNLNKHKCLLKQVLFTYIPQRFHLLLIELRDLDANLLFLSLYK